MRNWRSTRSGRAAAALGWSLRVLPVFMLVGLLLVPAVAAQSEEGTGDPGEVSILCHAEISGRINCLEDGDGEYRVTATGKYIGDGTVVAWSLTIDGQTWTGDTGSSHTRSYTFDGCGQIHVSIGTWYRVQRYGSYYEYSRSTSLSKYCPCYNPCDEMTDWHCGSWGAWTWDATAQDSYLTRMCCKYDLYITGHVCDSNRRSGRVAVRAKKRQSGCLLALVRGIGTKRGRRIAAS